VHKAETSKEGHFAHVWTRESISRFWDYQSRSPSGQDEYFTRKWGREIVRFMEFAGSLSGRNVLDYGSGPGHLSARLLEAGAFVTAADSSVDSLAEAGASLGGHANWRGFHVLEAGARISLPAAAFDAVFCVETIEHPLDEELSGLFQQIRNALKPGGRALFTTPNAENLAAGLVPCPQCGTLFHRWQHVRQWTPEGLASRLQLEGFQVEFCRGITFHPFRRQRRPSIADMSLRWVADCAGDLMAQAADRMSPRSFPNQRLFRRLTSRGWNYNLVAIARRRMDP
jgi:2-polyprenyl-3-methyl-5-hydroxy-6-metoxy-1,4-benzoquinol methylase